MARSIVANVVQRYIDKVYAGYMRVPVALDNSSRLLPMLHFDTGIPGPVVWLTAGAHGDEVGGVAVVQEVFKRIRGHLQCGSLHAFTLMNPFAFANEKREIAHGGRDLNRSFPGSDETIASRIAQRVFQTIVASTKGRRAMVLDLHNDWTHSVPYALIDPVHVAETSRMARRVGLVSVLDQSDKIAKTTLSGSLNAHGIPALTLELGDSQVINERNVGIGIRVVCNVLRDLGMLTSGEWYRHPSKVCHKPLHYTDVPRATSSGIIRFAMRPGTVVKRGDTLARIYNAFGKELEVLKAPSPGVLLCHADTSVVSPGEALFGIATPRRHKTTTTPAVVDFTEESVPDIELPWTR